MANHCEICEKTGSPGNPLIGLKELEAEHGGTPESFYLCQDCMQQREVASWPLRGPRAERVQNALERHADALHPRFTYLSDARRIHLLRLRPQWVHERLLAA